MIKTKEETLETLIEKLNKYENLLKNELEIYRIILESDTTDNSTVTLQKDRVETISDEIKEISNELKQIKIYE